MTDSTAGHPGGDHEPNGDFLAGLEGRGAAGDGPAEPRRRVIGTPPPAEARSMLEPPPPGAPGGPAPAEPRELPTGPADLVSAKRAERIVVACFTIAGLAGLGFIAAYVIFPVHTVPRVLHSNLALGSTMALTFLAMAAGAVIWVRRLMPQVELTEERKPLRSGEEERAAFKKTFEEGAEASQFVKRPMLRRSLIAASLPAVVGPIVLLRDLGPLPRQSLDHTVWRKGMRLLNYGSNTPIRPADFASPGGMITVVPDGYQDNFNALAKATCIIIKFAPGQVQFTSRAGPVPGKVEHRGVFEDLHARRLPCSAVRADDTSHTLPVSPVHVRRGPRGTGDIRPGHQGVAAAADDHRCPGLPGGQA